MSRQCAITGKKSLSGHKVSHSQAKTKRRFCANVHRMNILNPATGKKMNIKLSVSAHRTLKKWQAQGKQYDLRELIKE